MVWGTSSNAGKTITVATICRYLKRKGKDVAPFKGSNLSLNSYVTSNGDEIGMGQALQSWASGLEPEGPMNPVLIKPAGSGVIQYIVNGKVYSNDNTRPSFDVLMEAAIKGYETLLKNHEYVICEGSGSPVEPNLMERDVANIGMVRKTGMNTILVADIERGGVFAAIYGTWLLAPEDIRKNLKGFIINRFRGDPSILKSGIEKIEQLTGMKCIGIMPLIDIILPEEDTVMERKRRSEFTDVMSEYTNALDHLVDVAEENLDMDFITKLIS